MEKKLKTLKIAQKAWIKIRNKYQNLARIKRAYTKRGLLQYLNHTHDSNFVITC
jgi:uncharacterized protein YecT (DUF1311 family)